MSNTIISTTLNSGTIADLTQDKLDAIKGLIQTYIPGMANVSYGILLPGDENIKAPCVMLQPKSKTPKMYTTAKYHTTTQIDVMYYVGDDQPTSAVIKATNVGQIFEKLFSNNALGDLGSTNSNNFKQYFPHWIDSEMSVAQFSQPYKYWINPGPKYFAMGFFKLTLQTVQIE